MLTHNFNMIQLITFKFGNFFAISTINAWLHIRFHNNTKSHSKGFSYHYKVTIYQIILIPAYCWKKMSNYWCFIQINYNKLFINHILAANGKFILHFLFQSQTPKLLLIYCDLRSPDNIYNPLKPEHSKYCHIEA